MGGTGVVSVLRFVEREVVSMNFEDYDIPDSDIPDSDESDMFKLSSKGIDECNSLSRLFLYLCHYEYDYTKLYNSDKANEKDFKVYIKNRDDLINDIKTEIEGLMDIVNRLEEI
jgi:hypothetical protein